ncbi:cupin domain-containing protein [Homoserinibacter sp. YIM 151385]|uniref:cupin domain-containing protein n=1 Tax=Homoserinibacter sp. YIM 151385 TaxID=2985506 RepID=UPI0022F094CF|nr:cupin domain-containing protein [Homoserinibacter sp. YIM 151385]WBU36941.1 cupin domain-containing protein [Homoserinibacter sp. YIM 151385]
MTGVDIPGAPGEPLEPGMAILAAALELEHEPLPPEQVIHGAPTTAVRILEEREGRELGVWEMTPGIAWDVEVDETFVVLFGDATVDFEDGVDQGRSVALAPGTMLRLREGQRTRWTVRQTLRKVYSATL